MVGMCAGSHVEFVESSIVRMHGSVTGKRHAGKKAAAKHGGAAKTERLIKGSVSTTGAMP
jgi:hypothetical protein